MLYLHNNEQDNGNLHFCCIRMINICLCLLCHVKFTYWKAHFHNCKCKTIGYLITFFTFTRFHILILWEYRNIRVVDKVVRGVIRWQMNDKSCGSTAQLKILSICDCIIKRQNTWIPINTTGIRIIIISSLSPIISDILKWLFFNVVEVAFAWMNEFPSNRRLSE